MSDNVEYIERANAVIRALEENWKALLKGLGKTKADNKPLAYAAILEIWGLDGALWAAGAEPQYNEKLRAELEALKKYEREKWTSWAAALKETGDE